MNDEQLLIVLRDCFTGGYTLPQFCIDNNIKKPLFVAEEKSWQFAWEIYVQFRYDKRLSAEFSLVDAPDGGINFSVYGTLTDLILKNISAVNPNHFDKIIFLTSKRLTPKNSRFIYLDDLEEYFVKRTYCEIPLLNFAHRNPQVKLFMTKLPNSINRYPGGEEFAKTLTETRLLSAQIENSRDKKIQTPLDKFGYTNHEVYEMIHVTRGVKTSPDGLTTMLDSDSPLIRIHGGKRLTANQPAHWRNKIYFFGPCHYMGSYAPFDKTIESYLQQMLNEHNLPYRVENEGQTYFGRYQDMLYNLNALNFAPGDVVFVYINNLSSKTLPLVDLSFAFDPPHDYRELFVDASHINERGYKILAEKFFNLLTQNNFFRDVEFDYTPPPVNLFTVTEFRRSSSRA